MNRRWVLVLVVPLLCGLLVVRSADRAEAFTPSQPMTYVAPTAVGTGVLTEAGQACLAAGPLVCGAAAVLTAVFGYGAYAGTTRVLHWLFDDPQVTSYVAPGIVTPGSLTVTNSAGGFGNATGDPTIHPLPQSWIDLTVTGPAGTAVSFYEEWVYNDDGTGGVSDTMTVDAHCASLPGMYGCDLGGSVSGRYVSLLLAWNQATVPVGHADPDIEWRAIGVTVDVPETRWKVRTYCSGDVLVSESALFNEGDPEPINVTDCPGGATPDRVKVEQRTGADELVRTVIDVEPAESEMNDFPECLPGGVQYPCSVRLLKVVGTDLAPCTVTTVDCTTFEVGVSTEADYRCKWGTYDVALSDCALLQEQTAPTTGTGLTTEQRLDAEPIEPNTNPSLAPNGGQTNVGCMGGGWSLNPINWVLKPVKCALAWAFVPSGDPLTDLSAAYEGSIAETMVVPVDALAGAVSGVEAGYGVGGDCEGPSASVPLGGLGSNFTFAPLSTCGEPQASVAEGVYWLLNITFIVGGIFAGAKIVQRAFGVEVIE